jgi:hypothetical protein
VEFPSLDRGPLSQNAALGGIFCGIITVVLWFNKIITIIYKVS